MNGYVSKEDAIQAKCENLNPRDEYSKGWNDCNSMFVKNIAMLSPADVRPVVRGKWISTGGGFIRCSACRIRALQNGYGEVRLTDFCPNCGALMAKEKPLDNRPAPML